MKEQHTASLVLFCATLPVTIDPRYSDNERLLAMAPQTVDYDKLDSFLKAFKREFFKLGQGMFIMDEDCCYPALLQMIQHCHDQKYRFAIFPVGDAPVSLSPACHDLQSWLAERKKRSRLTSSSAAAPGK